MHLPDLWPAYLSIAKGCKVLDLEGMDYEDKSIMGIETNNLGYVNDEVDQAVLGIYEGKENEVFKTVANQKEIEYIV